MVFMSHLGAMPLAPKFFNDVLNSGWVGVELFFVLSGFLITTILLAEARSRKTVDFRAFLMRRILRIWPLYFVGLGLGFFVFPVTDPHAQFWRHLAAYAVFLGNYSMAQVGFQSFGFASSQLWSVCIEEHYYLVWGALLGLGLSRPTLALFALAAAGFSVFIPIALYAPNDDTWYLRSHTHMWSVMMGSLCGLAFSLRWLGVFRSRWQLLLLLPATWFFVEWLGSHLKPLPWTVVFSGLYFSYVLMLALAGPWWLGWLQSRPLLWLGRLTYGLYVFHIFALNLTRGWLSGFQDRPVLQYFLTGSIGLSLTIGVAWLSWKFLEKPILDLKRRFRPGFH